jgi:hypothetical protein
MASLRRRKNGGAVQPRTDKAAVTARSDETFSEERSPFEPALEEKWAEAWRQARRADLR